MIDLIPYRWLRLMVTIGLTVFLYYAMHQGYVLVSLQDSIWYELMMPILFMMYMITSYYVNPIYVSIYIKRSNRVFFNIFIHDSMKSIADIMIFYLSLSILFLNTIDTQTFQIILLYDLILYYCIAMLSLAVTQHYVFAFMVPIIWFLMPIIQNHGFQISIPFKLYTVHELIIMLVCSAGFHLIKWIKIYLR